MDVKIIPAIMSGGSGTRLWPLSTAQRPKQFHSIGSGRTLIQETAARFMRPHGDLRFLAPIVIAGAQHGDIIEQQLTSLGSAPALIVLEPEGRNTAATALVAALIGAEIDREALVLLVPADHVIENTAAFLDAIGRAAHFAKDRIVTFGIKPTEPATGYGYIQSGNALGDGVFSIERFREKPAREVAETFVSDPAFNWNAGVFLFAPEVVVEEFTRAPEVDGPVRGALARATRTDGRVLLERASFVQAAPTPFDIAIMQSTTRGAVAPCDIGWADLGSWAEIWRLSPKDASGNAVVGGAVAVDCENCLVLASGTPLAVSGLTDMLVIATEDGVLVAPRGKAQDVKELSAPFRDLAE